MNALYLDAAKKSISDAKKKLLKLKIKKFNQIGKETKINADYLINSIIFKNLKKTKLEILSEENEHNKNNQIIKKEKNFWIVDPVDGSYNLLRHIPFAGICITLVYDKKLNFSFIHDIFNNKTYFTDNEKITINGKKFTNNNKFCLKKNGILATGFPHKFVHTKDKLDYKKFQKIRMIGSASMSLIGCLSRQFDWYNEKKIMLWDVAAGVHLNKVANCKISSFNLSLLCQDVSIGYCK